MRITQDGQPIGDSITNTHDDLTALTSAVADIHTLVDTAQSSLDGIDEGVTEIEDHEHSYTRWFGATAGQTAASTANPAVTTGLTPFSVSANATAATWGTAVEIYHHNEEFDTKGTPAFFDLNEIFIANVGKTGIWRLRFMHGDNAAGAAAAVTAQNYSGVMFKMTANDADGESIYMQTERIPVGNSVWVQAMCDQATGGACTFLYGAHTYTA